jgi:hypothetical protein
MKFESVKCDQCQRIQDQANHWMKIMLWVDNYTNTIALGPLADGLSHLNVEVQELDSCGQGCTTKLIAKLLGWSAPTEGA